jgi:hypothetical protein
LFPGNYTIVEWEDVKARLIRPNLECTNGYIHIIDQVVMKRRDVSLISSAENVKVTTSFVVTFLAMFVVAFRRI